MIPTIVHHVWPGDSPFRTEMHRFRESWQRLHPDWSFFFWRKRSFGSALFDERVVKLLADRRYTVVLKSDVLRLWALHEFGGIYADTDVECLKSFDSLLTPGGGFFCGRHDVRYLSTAVMGSVPKHPLLAAMLDEALRRVNARSVEDCNYRTNEITGPYLLTELASGRSDVTMHPSEWFSPIMGSDLRKRMHEPTPHAYAKHYFYGWGADGWLNKQRFE